VGRQQSQLYAPGNEEQRDELPVWVIPRPLAQVRGIPRLEGEKLAGRLVGPGRGVCEGGIGQAAMEAVRRGLRGEQGSIDVVEEKGVEALEWDIHCAGRKGDIQAEKCCESQSWQ
jgi:hypothetical protein